MNEIKVGEYVRTERGLIAKIIGYDDDNNFLLDNQQIITKIESKNIQHSENIIDLVTMEDIFKIKEGDTIVYIGFTNNYVEEYADFIERVKNKEIELLEVLTKEQFSRNSYKVGE